MKLFCKFIDHSLLDTFVSLIPYVSIEVIYLFIDNKGCGIGLKWSLKESTAALIQDFYWRDYIPGDLPTDAYEAAEGRYIGQVYETGFLPGTIFPDSQSAIVEYSGMKIHTRNIKILCTHYPERFYWELVNFTNPPGNQMSNAVKGGYQSNIDEPIYIGKIFHEEEWKVGKVVSARRKYKGIWVWTEDGGGTNAVEFQLLKYNYTVVAEGGNNIICLIN